VAIETTILVGIMMLTLLAGGVLIQNDQKLIGDLSISYSANPTKTQSSYVAENVLSWVVPIASLV
jgi:hypothetical protein